MYRLDHFKDIIAEARRHVGLTQEDLAKSLGITPQAVSKWENGIGYPDVTLFPLIAQALNIPISRLFGKEEQVNIANEAHIPSSYGGLTLCGQSHGKLCYSNKQIAMVDEKEGLIRFTDESIANLLLGTATNRGSGEIRIYNLNDITPEVARHDLPTETSLDKSFDGISAMELFIAHHCKIEIKHDDSSMLCRAQAQGSADFISLLDISQNGETLTVNAENRQGQGDSRSNNLLTIYTASKQLSLIKCSLNGCTALSIEPNAKRLEIQINGPSDAIASSAESASLSINGAGDIKMNEVTGSADIKINGCGDVTLHRTASPNMEINGAGGISCGTVSGQITASVNGTGDISCTGDADRLAITINGSGGFHGDQLTVTDADIRISNDSSADIHIGHIRGVSTEKLSKNCTLTVNKRG